MAVLLIAAFGLAALGAAADLVLPLPAPEARRGASLLVAAAAACLLVDGVRADLGASLHATLGFSTEMGPVVVNLDALSGLFMTIISVTGLAVALSFASWFPASAAPRQNAFSRRGTLAAFALLMASVAAVLVAGDVFSFLFSWEALTVSFYALSASDRTTAGRVRASWWALALGKVGGAALLVGFAVIAAATGSFDFSTWHGILAGPHYGMAAAIGGGFALLLVGFGVKVGILPFHIWLPPGYSAAPGPARAAMAGVAMNAGIYGMWRFLGVLGAPPEWLVVVVLLAGGATALFGIAFASVQPDLNLAIAYSSIENAGIITTAYGVALVGARAHSIELEAIGLLAATLQAVAHALAKSTLFLSSASIEAGLATADLEQLRGVGRVLPWSGASFGIAALTLSGLPPTAGFVSEWFVLESLMQQFRVAQLGERLAMAGAGAAIALTTGIAAFAFLRLLGIVVLGEEASSAVSAAVRADPGRMDRQAPGRLALAGLSVVMLATAALAPEEIRFIARGLAGVVPARAVDGALASPWVLQPVFGHFSVLSPSWLWVVGPLLMAAIAAAAAVLSRGGLFKVRRVEPWHSASGTIDNGYRYTAFGFANPMRFILASLFRTRRQAAAPHAHGARPVVYSTRVSEPIEEYGYRPAGRAALWASRSLRRLQSGRLEAYIGYMLFAVVLVLAVAAAFGPG